MTVREYFPCYNSYLRKIAKLSDQEVGRLFRALLTYSATGEAQELTGREAVAYDFIADDIDRANEAYEDRCATNKRNRLSTTINDRKRSSTTDDERPQNKDKDKDKDENKDEENIGELRSPTRTRARFTPPSVDEVDAYARSIGKPIDAEWFVNFYTSKGWVVGKSPMKDWRAAVRNWAKSEDAKHPARRDYSGDELPW